MFCFDDLVCGLVVGLIIQQDLYDRMMAELLGGKCCLPLDFDFANGRNGYRPCQSPFKDTARIQPFLTLPAKKW